MYGEDRTEDLKSQKACSVLPTAIAKRDRRRKRRNLEKSLNKTPDKFTDQNLLKSPYAQTDIVNLFEVDSVSPLGRLCRYHYENEADYEDQYKDGYEFEVEPVPSKRHQRNHNCLCYQILSKTNTRINDKKEKLKLPPPILTNFPRQTTNVSTALQYYPRKPVAGEKIASMKRTTFEDARNEVLLHLRRSNITNNNVHRTTPIPRFESVNFEKPNTTSSSSTSCGEFPEERLYSPNQPIPNMIEYHPPPLAVRSHAKDVLLTSPIAKHQFDLNNINERFHIIYKRQISEQMRKYIPNANAKPPMKTPKKSQHKTNSPKALDFKPSSEEISSPPGILNKRGWKREVINDDTLTNNQFNKAKEKGNTEKIAKHEYKIKNKVSYVYIWDSMKKSGPLFAQNPNGLTDTQRKQQAKLFMVRPSRSLLKMKSESETGHNTNKKTKPISKVSGFNHAIVESEATEYFDKPKETRKPHKQTVTEHDSISSRIFRADYGIQLFPGILTQASKSSSSNVNPEEKVKFFVDIIINPEFEVLRQHPNKLRCIANKAISKKDEISIEQYYARPAKNRPSGELKETNYSNSTENLFDYFVKCNNKSPKPKYYYAYTESASSLRNNLHTTQSRPAEKSKRIECFYVPPRKHSENTLELSNEYSNEGVYMHKELSQDYVQEKPRDYMIFNKKSREYDHNNSRESIPKNSRDHDHNQSHEIICKKSRDCDYDRENIHKLSRNCEQNNSVENMHEKSRDFDYNNSAESVHKKTRDYEHDNSRNGMHKKSRELENKHSDNSVHNKSREFIHDKPKERVHEKYLECTYENSKESPHEYHREKVRAKNKESVSEKLKECPRDHKKGQEQNKNKSSDTKSTKHLRLVQLKSSSDECGNYKAPDPKQTKYLRLIQPKFLDEDIIRDKHNDYDESNRSHGKSMRLHVCKSKEYKQVVSCLSSKNPYPDIASGDKAKMDEFIYYAKMKTKMQRKYYGAILLYDVRPRPLSVLMNVSKCVKSHTFLATTSTPPTIPRRYKKSRRYGGRSKLRTFSGLGNLPQTKNTSIIRRHFFSGNSTELEEETSMKYSKSSESGSKEVKTVSSKSIQIEFESSECLKNIRQIRSTDTEAQSINSIQSIQSNRRKVYKSIDELCTPSNITLIESKKMYLIGR